jgi:hypothetical protein
MEISNKCTVSLKSPTGFLYDQTEVLFNTVEHGTKFPRDLKMKNEESQKAAPPAPPQTP